jgi:ubiquinone/menaquinone biosynthesis C-methylase UbiE
MRSTPEASFVRADGRPVRVVPGFRERVLGYRPSTTPRPEWTPEEYARAADKKLERARRLVAEVARRHTAVEGGRVLDVGCGDGINCLVMAHVAHARVVGADLRLPLFEPVEQRRLAELVIARLDRDRRFADVVAQLPVRFTRADATSLPFPDDSFDVLLSRSALEHIVPVERALAEMARVTRAGGVIHHAVDPYYWLRGCHKRGVVDIPWAHARLSLEDFQRFVTESEGAAVAAKRCSRLQTLNRLTLAQWRAAVEAGPFDILEWTEEPSAFAAQLLDENPDVIDTLASGVEPRDLVIGRLEFWLRVRKS